MILLGKCSINVEEEAHCYVVQCRRIVCGQYVADYSTTECRTFRPEGLRQLHTKLFCTQLMKARPAFSC